MGATTLKKKEEKLLHPRECANCFSSLFFCWTLPSFIKGLKSPFNESDLTPPLRKHESTSLGDILEDFWSKEIISSLNPSLWKPLNRIFGKEFLLIGIIVFINEFVVRLSQPILIWKLITSYKDKDNDIEANKPYIYGFLIVVSSFANTIFFNWYIFLLRELSMKMRIACSSLIYRKSLKLNRNGIKKAATGQVVNLLSNDLNRFDKLFLHMHYLWAAPLEAIIVTYLSYTIVDDSATVGIMLFVLFIPVQIYMGKKYSDFRLSTATKTDERVRLVNEMLSGIQVIKMHTWEKLFHKFINNTRKLEIKYIRKTSFLKAFQNAFNKFISKGGVFLCVLVYILTGHHLESQYIFVIKSFYNLLKESMTTNFPEAIKNISEALVSVQRIEQFLVNDEIRSKKTRKNIYKKSIYIEKVTAQWSSSAFDTLSEINFEASSRQLITVVGTVGSGKTSLINLILGELPKKTGTLRVNGTVSYACQESWLFAGTIKQNILFGQPFDDARYKEVVKICALKHDFELLPFGDNSIVGDKGITLSGGQKARISLARAVYRKADIYLLDDPLSAVDASVGKQLFNECILNYLKDKCVVLVTHQLQYLKKSDVIYVLKDGQIVTSGSYEQIYNSGEDFAQLLQKDVEHEDSLIDYDVHKMLSNQKEEGQFEETKNFGKIPWKIYKEYLLSGGWCAFSGIIILFIISQILQSGTDYFESFWVRLETRNMTQVPWDMLNLNNCLYIYSALMVLILLFSTLTSIAFFAYFINASVKLHDRMFSAVVKATINFFYINPAGSVLNRFSKDMGVIDTYMPKYLVDTLEIGLNVIAIMTIIALVSPWMLIGSTILLFIFYVIRMIYIETSREIKRIEAITRSPVYSHLNESLHGLETIRAFEVQAEMRKRFDIVLNRNTSAFYMYLSMYTTFGFWLDFLCSIYLGVVTTSCFFEKGVYGEDIGLVITQAISLTTMFQWGMKQWSEFENEMISVERIVQYINLDPEKVEGSKKTWPKSTDIQFRSVTLKYKDSIPAALNDLNFTVAPQEKVGIVGRTGAGKTSIISALFRLIQFNGCVIIGGVDTKDFALPTLRSNISIIPQEPVLFSCPIRENLDPFNQFTDFELWTTLEELDLKTFVENLPGGLHSQILENGSNLSMGQKQLFCLARALLRKNKILVLDEATANVDFKTDSLIQMAIKTKLADCTVLIIAHRLHTIMDCDKVLVMDAGKIVEFDHPHKLLENEEGALYCLVEKTGHNMAHHLKRIAKENYFQRYKGTRS